MATYRKTVFYHLKKEEIKYEKIKINKPMVKFTTPILWSAVTHMECTSFTNKYSNFKA